MHPVIVASWPLASTPSRRYFVELRRVAADEGRTFLTFAVVAEVKSTGARYDIRVPVRALAALRNAIDAAMGLADAEEARGQGSADGGLRRTHTGALGGAAEDER